MQHAEALEAVRHFVRGTFVELGADIGSPLTEHILLRDDAYCGRRFCVDGLQAIWFIEEDQIKIHAQDGSVARVLSVEEAVQLASTTEKRAA
ncbi:MAG: hypothetical protein GX575_01380 [Candidatus Anammoximicrobium sp.]|nr:hypothetical protein [Candidatus Anammoximicrobium sp.]